MGYRFNQQVFLVSFSPNFHYNKLKLYGLDIKLKSICSMHLFSRLGSKVGLVVCYIVKCDISLKNHICFY
jgi:hypothetical protein